MHVSIVLEDGTLVPIDDWLNAKSQFVELALDLKRDVSCQGTTRDIEHEMLACPSETLQISGRSYEGHKMEFPLDQSVIHSHRRSRHHSEENIDNIPSFQKSFEDTNHTNA